MLGRKCGHDKRKQSYAAPMQPPPVPEQPKKLVQEPAGEAKRVRGDSRPDRKRQVMGNDALRALAKPWHDLMKYCCNACDSECESP